MQDGQDVQPEHRRVHDVYHPNRVLVPGILTPAVGPERLSLCIGGVGFLVTTADPGTTRLVVDDPTRSFLGPAGTEMFHLRVRRGDLAGIEPRGEPVFDAGDSWRLTRDDGGWVFDFYTPLNGARPYLCARVNERLDSGEIILHEGYYRGVRDVDPLQFPLAELLAIQKLARSGGVVLHACGVVDENGDGILFVGRSGDGKTSTARLWKDRRGVTVLSDDRIILRRESDGFRMYGTPWHGEEAYAVNADARVSALFLLEHGSASEPVPLSPASAVASLLSRCFPPFHDRGGLANVVESLSALAQSVGCWRFPFTLDDAAVAAARGAVSRLPENRV